MADSGRLLRPVPAIHVVPILPAARPRRISAADSRVLAGVPLRLCYTAETYARCLPVCRQTQASASPGGGTVYTGDLKSPAQACGFESRPGHLFHETAKRLLASPSTSAPS